MLKEKSECPHSLLPVTLLLVVAGPAAAEARAERTLSPYFLVQGEEATGTFPLSSTHVTVEISGVVADVRVEQTYVNEGSEPINARYVFPASTRAAVHGMRMRVGEEVVVAKIREREVARQEFEEAKGTGKTTSLLDEERPNVFTMNVSNIMPADRVEVELNYTELLVPTERTYSFVYPAVVGPRYGSVPEDTAPATECWIKSPYLPQGDPPSATFDIELTLSAGLPVAETRSPSHEVASSWDGSTRVHVRLADPSDFGGDRDFVWDYRLAGMEIEAGLLLQRGETENYFLLVLQPPAVVGGGDLPAREYVFVLDVSGSMDGFPLETAKAVIADLISGLGQTDRFNVILFAGGSSVLASASVPATPENVAHGLAVIEGQHGGGGTELRAALARAVALPRSEGFARVVAIITDGFVEAERESFDLITEHLRCTSFFAFGIGSSVNRYLIEGLARAGQGEPFVVTRPDEAQAAAARFRRTIESPLLTGIEVAYDGFDVYDVEPPVLPDLLAERPVVLFGKWRGMARGTLELSGTTARGPWSQRIFVPRAPGPEENRALSRLWARERISRLSDFGFGRQDPASVAEVTALGLSHSLLTPYTSFIAVLEPVRNPDAQARDVDQPLPLARGTSRLAVGYGYAAGSEPELWLVLAVLALAALGRRVVSGSGSGA